MRNIIARLAAAAGNIRGAYLKGIGASITDPSVWSGDASRYWGEGVGGKAKLKKFNSKDEMISSFLSWVYICVRLRAENIAAVPLRLYVVTPVRGQKFRTITTRAVAPERRLWVEGRAAAVPRLRKATEIVEVTDHAFLGLIDAVNPIQNKRDLLELTSTFLDLTGECYWWLERGSMNQPEAIWIVPSQHMTPIPGTDLKEPIKGYLYERGKTRVTFPPEDIVWFNYPNPANQFQGMSIMAGIADAVYTNEQMFSFEEALFENKARVGGIVESGENYSEESVGRLRSQWSQIYAGAAKGGRTLFLPKGMKFTRDSITPDEMSFIEGKKITREEICAGFDIPIGALVSTDVNRANADTADYRFMKNGILPALRRLEDKINERIMPLYDERLFVAFDNPVPEDKEFALREREANIRMNLTSINEERREVGRDDAPWGEDVFIDAKKIPYSAMADGNVGGEAVEPEPEAGAKGSAASRLAAEAAAKLREMLGA